MKTLSIALLTIAAGCAASGQLLFKLGAEGNTRFIEYLNLSTLSGLALYIIGALLWIYALSFEKLLYVYSYSILTFVLVCIGGVVFLNESLPLGSWMGIAFVFTGLCILSYFNG